MSVFENVPLLYSLWSFTNSIIGNAPDSSYFVYDTSRDLVKELMRKWGVIGRDAMLVSDDSQRADELVGSGVLHDSKLSDWQD